MAKIVVLISGSGSNLQALIDASTGENPTLKGDICRVISSSDSAFGLERAKKAGIPTTIHTLKSYNAGIPKASKKKRKRARDQFDADLAKLVINENPDLVVCAGWMLILSLAFLNPISKANIPIINLHPALPGTFEGTHAIERSWEAGQKGEITKGGCMIHYVIEAVDLGEPIVVKEIPIIKDETVEAWEERIHNLEHIAIVEGAQAALDATKNTETEEKSNVEEVPVVAEEKTVEEETPVTEEPTVEETVADETPVVAETLVEEKKVEETPVVEEPAVAEDPAVTESAVEEKVVEEPVIEEPVIEEPTVEEPVVEKPVTEEPVVKEPTAEDIIEDTPVVEETPVAEVPVVETSNSTEQPTVEETPVSKNTPAVAPKQQEAPTTPTPSKTSRTCGICTIM
ncbi:phosphoribosylglycinamide formyltransferase [Pichia kluyveri]|uniref:Phosphoribosylglycinamide formyltransferase n=1 Tax=Pichia kluyveri TaxID=36015 RepID=A0AAV5R9Z6_PICKL|nr:phosphoribosylglycinamide formyltransferase [Pichia kluyveri]